MCGYYVTTIILLSLTVGAKTQFFDFFQPFQPYLQTYKPIVQRQKPYDIPYIRTNEQNTRKPSTAAENARAGNKQTRKINGNNQRNNPSTKSYIVTYTESPLDQATKSAMKFESFIDVPKRQDGEQAFFKETKTVKNRNNINNYTSTTPKPLTSQKSHNRHNNRKPAKTNLHQNDRGKNVQSSQITQGIDDYLSPGSFYSENFDINENRKDKRRPAYENKEPNINNNINTFTTRPIYQELTSKLPIFNYNNRFPLNNNQDYSNYNSWTTQNPFYVRPPVVNENRPPITNKPPEKTTRNPNYNQKPIVNVPTDGAIVFPVEEDDGPDILLGPDEDFMTDSEKRRYVDLAERMCDKYKGLQIRKVEAIPLLPSPVPVAVNVTKCVPVTVPLVVGGKVVSIKEFPHMALLGWTRLQGGGYSWKCGGSLISDQYVLTAAHCAYQERDNTVVSGPPRVVQLGSSFLDDPGAIVIKVSTSIRHPKYKLPKSYYDLAVLKLANRVTFSERIRPACLGVPPPAGNPVIATGWGRTEFGGEQSQELRSVSIPVWNINECYSVLGTSRKLPNGPSVDSQICAGEIAGGKDTCQGDSGGPIQTQEGCNWRVVGVTSLGRSCGAAHTPGLYAIAQRAFISAIVFGGR